MDKLEILQQPQETEAVTVQEEEWDCWIEHGWSQF